MTVTSDKLNARIDYVHRHYALFTALTNTMINFFLVGATVLAASYVGIISSELSLRREAAIGIAVFGAFLSFLFGVIDWRSRRLMKEIEKDFLSIEDELFDKDRPGFITRKEAEKKAAEGKGKVMPTFRSVFRLMYFGFGALFLIAFLFPMFMPPE